jgi:hypothetical protein
MVGQEEIHLEDERQRIYTVDERRDASCGARHSTTGSMSDMATAMSQFGQETPPVNRTTYNQN